MEAVSSGHLELESKEDTRSVSSHSFRRIKGFERDRDPFRIDPEVIYERNNTKDTYDIDHPHRGIPGVAK